MADNSIALKLLYAPAPRPTRGKPFVVNVDPTGKKFIYAHGKVIYIRDVACPEITETYHMHAVNTTVAAFSPSGFYICSGDESGKVIVWDTTQAEHVTKYEGKQLGGAICDISWSDDSKRIAVCGAGSEKYVHAFLADSGSSVGAMSGPVKTCNSVSFKQTRPYRIITGSEDFSSYYYSGPPFKLESSIRHHTNFVNVVRYSPNGSHFATGSSDGRVLLYDGLYDGKKGEAKGCFGGERTHEMGVTGVCWSANNQHLLTTSSDRTVKLWDVETNQLLTQFDIGARIPDDMQCSCLFAGELILSVAVNGSIYYLDKNNPAKPIRVLTGHQVSINSLSCSQDGAKTYSYSYDGRCLNWMNNGFQTNLCKGAGHVSRVGRSIRVNDKIYSVGIDLLVKCIDVNNDSFTDLAIPLDSEPNDIQASADGILFVSCLQHVIVIKNDVILKSHPMAYGPLSCSFSDQQQQLAVLGGNNVFYVYQYSPDGSLNEIYTSEAHMDIGACIRYSPDGKFLAVTTGRYLIILNPNDNFAEVKKSGQATAKITFITWSKDSTLLAMASLDTHLSVYSVASNFQYTQYHRAHPNSVISTIEWVDNNTLYSTGDDTCIRRWEYK